VFLRIGEREGRPPVIPKICNHCDQQYLGKPISLYWAWVRADGHRTAWKQKVCSDCFREHYVRLIVIAEEPLLACPACGISTVDDMDAVYLTYCVPGSPQSQSEMPLCPSCAVGVRNHALTGAVALPDRGVAVGGPQPPAQSGAALWDSLGLAPERRNG
jgi:hypothetical protein